ncbi:hypothetical protein TNCV_1194291 [Trichonephila clavipes]|nr:hypothetical protein TNCV_1194291 [Trichonephila clavipes]
MVSRWPNLMCERIVKVRWFLVIKQTETVIRKHLFNLSATRVRLRTTPQSAMSIEVTKYDKGCWQLINQPRQFQETREVIFWAKLVEWVESPSKISASEEDKRSGSEMTPRHEFNDLHHLELQDRRDYTPADRAARTCWLGCPGSCTIWRPETQNSAFLLYPLHGRFLQDPTSPVQRSSKVQNPAPSARFPREQSVVSSYQ